MHSEHQRRHQTLIFWDYSDLDPEQLGTTVPRFTRRLLDFLRDEKIKTGGSVTKAYLCASVSPQVNQQLQDLQVAVTCTPNAKMTLSHDLQDIITSHHPDNASVVLLTNDKDFVPSIKRLADQNCFSVFLVHAIPKSNDSLTDMLETFATRSFHASSVFGEILQPQTSTKMTNLGSFGVTAGVPPPQTNTRTLPMQQPILSSLLSSNNSSSRLSASGLNGSGAVPYQPQSPIPQQPNAQILVEGQLVRVDDILQNEGFQRLCSGSTVNWCTYNLALHDPINCPKLHRKIPLPQMTSVAHNGSFGASASAQSLSGQNALRSSPPLPTYMEHVATTSPLQIPAVPKGPPVSVLQRGLLPSSNVKPSPQAQQTPLQASLPPPLPTASPWQRTAPSVVQETSRQAALQSNAPPPAMPPTAWDIPNASKEQAAQSMDLLLRGTSRPSGLSEPDDYLEQLAMKMLGHSIAEELAVQPTATSRPVASLWDHPETAVSQPTVSNGKSAVQPPSTSMESEHLDNDGNGDDIIVNVESVRIPVSKLVKNQAVEYLCRNPDKRGRWCQTKPSPSKPHDPQDCTFVHAISQIRSSSQEQLGEGSEDTAEGKFISVAGKRVLVSSVAQTKGVTYLLNHPEKQGKWCPTTTPHNIRECAYIHPAQAQSKPSDAPVSTQQQQKQQQLPNSSQQIPAPPQQRYRDAVAPSSDEDENCSPTMASILAQKVKSLAEPTTTHVTVEGSVVSVKDLEQNEGLRRLVAGTARPWCKISTQHSISECKSIHKKKPQTAAVAAAVIPRAKPSQPDQSRKLPAKFNIDGESVPLNDLVQNKFIEGYNGDNTGRWCTDSRPHSISQCTYAHRNQFTLLQGGKVDGSTLLRNLAYDNLLSNSHFRGNYCTSAKPHDPMKCTYLHKK